MLLSRICFELKGYAVANPFVEIYTICYRFRDAVALL
jgi:hypothetical protein